MERSSKKLIFSFRERERGKKDKIKNKFSRRIRKTYIRHLLIAEAIRLRRILRDGPHGQMIPSEQPFRRL